MIAVNDAFKKENDSNLDWESEAKAYFFWLKIISTLVAFPTTTFFAALTKYFPLPRLLFVSISLTVISGAFFVVFLNKADHKFTISYVSMEAFNVANFVACQTMIQSKMQPDSRGTIIGIQGITIGFGIGTLLTVMGRVYDDIGKQHAFAIPFICCAVYWFALLIFIIYRKAKGYSD
jgi:predicted MFS family arabinose efflux permease